MSSFFAYAEYKSKLYFKAENKQTDVRISFVKECIEIMQIKKAALKTFLINVQTTQHKYYNQKHFFKKYNKNDLILLSAKNLQSVQFNKKLSFKYIESF